jgi:protein-tyrosine phosphatase
MRSCRNEFLFTMDCTEKFIAELQARLMRGENVHCRQQIGRSGLIAIALLAGKGIALKHAIELASSARGREVPETEEQSAWLRRFVDYKR